MRITDLLSLNSICLDAEPKTKTEALDQAIDLMAEGGCISDIDAYRDLVYTREEEGSTGVGDGIAIPHGRGDCVSAPGLAAMVIRDGIEYEAIDDAPVYLLFLIAAPNTQDNVHLDVLSKLSMMLIDTSFVSKLLAAEIPQEFLEVINEADEERDQKAASFISQMDTEGKVQNFAESTVIDEDSVRQDVKIVAVTSCPTGIAHTYMAAESLKKAAELSGASIRIETRGASGAKNVLTDDEIAQADGVIVAADARVPMERFIGKKLIEVRVADGIHRAQELIDQVSGGDATIYQGEQKEELPSVSWENSGATHLVYGALMNGVSHMLPFVIGGGLLTALALLIDTIAGYGAIGGASLGSITPAAALMQYIGSLAMGLMVPVLAGYIAYAIAGRPALAVGFVGGILASSGNAPLMGLPFVGGRMVTGQAVSNFGQFIMKYGFQPGQGDSTVSGFLGGIAAGFLAGGIVLLLEKICKNMPASLDGVKPTLIYPFVGIFLEGILMSFIFNPLIGIVNSGLSKMLTILSSAGMLTILGFILGAMMAIDMGGPINKAAYVFGNGMLTTAAGYLASGMTMADMRVQACYIAMAAIMVGGMVPPMGIALACFVFPKKFTTQQRHSALSNIVMGCSFITEGAIPFAASDPLHVIPCTMIGAGVAGFLSAMFGCTLMAPHGGIFVFATVGHPFMYIIAWAAGSAVTCLMLGVLKKNVNESKKERD